jgi:hypothetical protein
MSCLDYDLQLLCLLPSVDFTFPNSETMSSIARLTPANAAPPPEQKQADLCEITKDWIMEVGGTDNPSYTMVKKLKQKLVAYVKEWMEINMMAREQESSGYMSQSREQQNFWLDETVALELELFFKDKGRNVGSCALWVLMHQAGAGIECEHSTTTQEGGAYSMPSSINRESSLTSHDCTAIVKDDDASRELVMALVRAFPKQAFEATCPLGHYHPPKVSDSPFTIVAQAGSLHLVKYMIDKVLNQPPQGKCDQQETKQNIKTWLVKCLTSGRNPRSSLSDAIYSYRIFKTKNYLEILEEILKLDNGEDIKPNDIRLMDGHNLLLAMRNIVPDSEDDNHSLRILEMALKDRSDLKTIETLKTAFDLNNRRLVELVIMGATINQEMAKKIINQGREDVWSLPSTQKAMADLLGDNEIARQLFRWTLDNFNQSGSAKYQPGPSNVKTLPHNGSRFLEDILRDIGSFDLDVRAEIIKRGMLWFWEMPSVQKLWREEKAKEKAEDKGMCMLHIAVQYQQVEMVEYFLNVEPDSVTKRMKVPTLDRDDGGVYALWHNNYVVPSHKSSNPGHRKGENKASSDSKPTNRGLDGGPEAAITSSSSFSANTNSIPEEPLPADPRKTIRDLLVPMIIERASGMGSLAKIFRESGGEFKHAKLKLDFVLRL